MITTRAAVYTIALTLSPFEAECRVKNMAFQRSSGILLHPTSFPSRFGIGDLGDEAFAFVDFLEASGQSLWQTLPLGPTGFGDSPYQCFSAFAGNPLLVSPERLASIGLLSDSDIEHVPQFSAERIEFGRVIEYKNSLLAHAFENFIRASDAETGARFLAFCQQEDGWLDDYALFRALKNAHGGAAWNRWSRGLAKRDRDEIAEVKEKLRDQILAEKFYQFLFFDQWLALKEYARKRGIKIIGDIPIFVSYDSADVWTHPESFKLDADRNPIVVAGVPPDYFSKTGQLWGNPIYDWNRVKENGFHWWIERFKANFKLFDIIRLDHFRGFAACWEVPAGDKTSERGRWVEVPGRELLTILEQTFNELPIIAEDLGVITPDVEELRDDFRLPGMRILQFAFSSDSSNIDLPHNYAPNSVVYTGTHDNDTTVGWFNSREGKGSTRSEEQIERERKLCLKYLRSNGREIHWDFIREAFASVACFAIAPMQDVLGLDSSARMNLPASSEGNWGWRMPAGALNKKICKRLYGMAELYGRLQKNEHSEETDEAGCANQRNNHDNRAADAA
ncbi:MAG TPA: 4-alpha-glucanotransferase, partial [Blastocatellia bacterium]